MSKSIKNIKSQIATIQLWLDRLEVNRCTIANELEVLKRQISKLEKTGEGNVIRNQ